MEREYLYLHKVIYEHVVCTKIRTNVIPSIVNNSISHTKLGIKEGTNYVQSEGIALYMLRYIVQAYSVGAAYVM